MEAVIEQLILLKTFLIISAIGTLLITLGILLYCRKFGWNKKNIRILGFFYDSSMADSIILAVCALKFYLVISLFFTKGKIELIHICLFGALVLVYNVCRHNFKDAGVSLFNGIVIMGVLYVSNFLLAYLNEVLFDIKIAIALVFLAIFLLLYSLYDIACSILAVVNSRKKIKLKDGVNTL